MRQRNEIMQQRQRQEEFAATLRQQDAEIVQLQEKPRILHESAKLLNICERNVLCSCIGDSSNIAERVGPVVNAANFVNNSVMNVVNYAGLVASATNFANSASISRVDSAIPRVDNVGSAANHFDLSTLLHSQTSIKLKPDTYNISAPLREFLTQFNLTVRANRWKEETKTAILLMYLRSKAHTVLENMQNLKIYS